MDFIDILLDQKLLKIGRSSNLFWIIFGNLDRELDALEQKIIADEYSLHFQCPWRIIDEHSSKIILASGDVYEPNSEIGWTENFDWEPQGNNLFDEKVKCLFPDDTGIRVTEVLVSKSNDIKLSFSNKFTLECFVNISAEEECWRLFKKGGNKHLVVSGNTKEFE